MQRILARGRGPDGIRAVSVSDPDVVVVGAGIVGLAVANEVARRRPRAAITVLEREQRIAAHQTSHSSGVIHAGLYYEPGSLKARLTRRGVGLLYGYCAARGIEARACGKLVVATREAELPRLAGLFERARANGVPGLRMLGSSEIASVEPHAAGLAALHSPRTGVVDFEQVARALARDLFAAGHEIATGAEVVALEPDAHGVAVRHSRGSLRAGTVVCCAGLWSDRLARLAGGRAEPRIVPFRGAYARLRPDRAHLVRALVYPVPDPALPFLGVHLTRDAHGGVLVGPTALPALSRTSYRGWEPSARDLAEALAWRGAARMAWRHRRHVAAELRRTLSRRALAGEAARLVPELGPGDLEPAPAGIRAQALDRSGRLLDDFAFERAGRVLHVRNAPSPAATAALAIAEHVAGEMGIGAAPG